MKKFYKVFNILLFLFTFTASINVFSQRPNCKVYFPNGNRITVNSNKQTLFLNFQRGGSDCNGEIFSRIIDDEWARTYTRNSRNTVVVELSENTSSRQRTVYISVNKRRSSDEKDKGFFLGDIMVTQLSKGTTASGNNSSSSNNKPPNNSNSSPSKSFCSLIPHYKGKPYFPYKDDLVLDYTSHNNINIGLRSSGNGNCDYSKVEVMSCGSKWISYHHSEGRYLSISIEKNSMPSKRSCEFEINIDGKRVSVLNVVQKNIQPINIIIKIQIKMGLVIMIVRSNYETQNQITPILLITMIIAQMNIVK